MSSSLSGCLAERREHKYWVCADTSETLQAELALIPVGASVLEIGAGPGHMTQAMAKKGCKIVALEVDPEAATFCRPFATRVIIGDVERLELEPELVGERFDVILFGDVLEHLAKPELVLNKSRKYLNHGGFLVMSLPNVAHGSVRLALLQGDFTYQSLGLLDVSHLRFFTLRSIASLLHDNGYEMQELRRIRKGLFDSEVPFDPLGVSAETLRAISADQEATTYQYIVKAKPTKENETSEQKPVSIHGVDALWSSKQTRSELALNYKKLGVNFFWRNPRKFRQCFYRAFRLEPRLVTSAYIGLSFLPYRVLKPIDLLLDTFSMEKMIPELKASGTNKR